MLFSEPKIPQSFQSAEPHLRAISVSVLFSEPKIPQSVAEKALAVVSDKFQCSSASRKFLNPSGTAAHLVMREGFSALQRAENSSIPTRSSRTPHRQRVSVLFSEPKIPQSMGVVTAAARFIQGFSALQRAENSSISFKQSRATRLRKRFSALQRAENSSIHCSGAPTRC